MQYPPPPPHLVPEQSHPPLSKQTPSKNWDPVKPHLFANLVGGTNQKKQKKYKRGIIMFTIQLYFWLLLWDDNGYIGEGDYKRWPDTCMCVCQP